MVAAQATTVDERSRMRALHNARVADTPALQQNVANEQYMQSVAQGITGSRVAAQPTSRTNAQIKQDLNDERSAIAQKQASEKSPRIQRELKKQQKVIANYQRINWTVLYAVGFLDDLLDVIPIPGMSFLPSLYITVKLRRVGPVQKQKSRMGWRIILMIIDMIPIINIAPISLGIVYNAKESERKRVEKARKFIKKNGG